MIFLRKKRKRTIPPDLLEPKYFEEVGYLEFYEIYDKFIVLFHNKSYKKFKKADLVKLAKLIGDRCCIEAGALHGTEDITDAYKKMKKVSELGLQLSKNDDYLLKNLEFATEELKDFEEDS